MTANNSENGAGGNPPDAKSTPGKTSRVKCSESRKIRKPLMEKRRRARINHSLNELKRMLLEANGTPTRKEGSRPAKLEKADILELTVRHLQTLQSSKVPATKGSPLPQLTSDSDEDSSSSSSTLPMKPKPEKRTATIHPSTKSTTSLINYQELSPIQKSQNENVDSKSNYMNGFTECIRMMTSSLETLKTDRSHEELEDHVKMQLKEANHFAQTYYNNNNNPCDNHPVHDLHSNLYVPEHRFGEKMDLGFENQDKRYTLHPTRMPNGDWAFILKCSSDTDNHGIKMEPELTEMDLAASASLFEHQRLNQPNNLFLQHQLNKDNHQRFLWRPW